MSAPLGQNQPRAVQGSVAGPLTPDHLRALGEARFRARKVRRAAVVAMMSGGTLAFFALITLLCALFGDLASLLMGIGLAVVAVNEFRGGAMLRRLETNGAITLAYNQIALGVLIVAYSAWSLYYALSNPVMASVGGSTGDPGIDAMVTQLNLVLAWGIYGGMGVFGIVGPGLSALYYCTRLKYVRAVVDQTPPWVIQTMRAAA